MGENGLDTIPLNQYVIWIIYSKNNSGSTLCTLTKFPVLGKAYGITRSFMQQLVGFFCPALLLNLVLKQDNKQFLRQLILWLPKLEQCGWQADTLAIVNFSFHSKNVSCLFSSTNISNEITDQEKNDWDY